MAAAIKPAAESEDVRRAVTIDYKNIQHEYCTVPSDLSRWILRRVEATKAHRLAELELEVLEESTKIDTRAAIMKEVQEGARKPPTVDELESLVATNPSIVLAKRQVIEAAEKKEYAAGLVRGIESKETMLVSLGADVRSEKKGDPSIREPQREQQRPRKIWQGRR